MKLEWTILVIVWILTFILFFFIPRRKSRLAQAAILFKQLITWFIGLVVVEIGLIEYPVRCFPSVNRSSFTFEFLSYPVICGLFNARYPAERSLIFKLFYFSSYCTVITVVEVTIEKYTELITYVHWSWYFTWITLFITFSMSRAFCKWFFSLNELAGEKDVNIDAAAKSR